MSASAIDVRGESTPWIPSPDRVSEPQVLSCQKFLIAYGLPLFVASLLQTGYAVYVGNHALQLPLVYLLNDPSLYPHDPFVVALRSYATWFWPAIAWGARIVPLGWLLLFLFLCERALLLYAAGALARTFAPRSELAVVAAMTIFASGIQPLVGDGTIVEKYTEQTGFAIPFLLLAIVAFYGRRPLATATWLAIGCNVNILYGMYTLSYVAIAWLVDPEYRRAWRRWIPAAGVFLLLSSPIVVLTALAFGQGATNKALWYVAAQARHAHHLFPLRWSKPALAMQVILLVLVAMLFTQKRSELPRLSYHARIWTAVAAGWLVYAFVAAYGLKIPSLLVISAGRAMDLWLCFASVVLVSVIASAVQGSVRDDRVLWLFALAGSVLVWAPEMSASVVGLGLLVMAGEPVRQWVIRASTRRIAVALVACVFLTGAVKGVHREVFGTADENVFAGTPETANIAEWARRNTPQDAVFLIDPSWGAFRMLSRRPVFVTFQDGSAILWNRAFVKEWVGRLHAIGLEVADGARIRVQRPWLTSTYDRLTDVDARRLSEWASVRYWVVPRDQVSAYAVVYQRGSYKVLKIE
jgi:hypothetical protein